MREVESYPLIGSWIRFPETGLRHLAPLGLRDIVREIEWDPATQQFTARIKDAALLPSTERAAMLKYTLDFENRRARLKFEQYDRWAVALAEAMEKGMIEKCCGVAEDRDLREYSRHLVAQVALFDTAEADPRWQPFVVP